MMYGLKDAGGRQLSKIWGEYEIFRQEGLDVEPVYRSRGGRSHGSNDFGWEFGIKRVECAACIEAVCH
jgi:hypothetical protein